jgi:CBS domain-containing protein
MMAVPDRQGPKRRQQAHRSASPGARPGRPKRDNRELERVRDVARRPKKYFVARRLQESEMTPTALAKPPRRRRPAAAPGRAPAVGPETLVSEIMVTDVVTIDAAATLLDAARAMRDANVGMLPVLDAGRLRGVVTDRDLVVRAMAEGVEPGTVPVRECLTEHVIAAGPSWTSDRAMQTMATGKLGRLPVVDDRGRVVGVVTLSSLVLRGRDREEALETAKEVSRRSARRSPAA